AAVSAAPGAAFSPHDLRRRLGRMPQPRAVRGSAGRGAVLDTPGRQQGVARIMGSERPLAGQHAIVVGGGSGIGLGSARLLARDGATVTIAGRTESKLRDAAAKLRDDDGVEVSWTTCDAL